MTFETIVTSQTADIITVSLNRPDVHNAMNEQLMVELTQCFQQLSTNSSIRCIILTGNGKSFCAGADLNWMKSMVSYTKEENIKDSRLLLDLYETINSCPKPVIGKINGHAFGGGLGLIAVCDVTMTIPGRKFAFSEANLGIIPSVISTFVAPRMKPADMRRFFITAERFDSEIAKQIGLIDQIVQPDEFDQAIQQTCDRIKSSGPQAIAESKNLISRLQTLDRSAYTEFTVEKIAELRISHEGQEGITAFLEKRKPNWSE